MKCFQCIAPPDYAEHWYHSIRYWCKDHTPLSGHYEHCGEHCEKLMKTYRIGPSATHGVGVFANRLIRKGEIIPQSVYDALKGKRGFNHSCDANVKLIIDLKQGEILDNFLRDVQEGEEITSNYRLLKSGMIRPGESCNCPVCRSK